MNNRGTAARVGLAALVAVLLACTGCAYLRDRYNDATDMVDVGVTVSNRPSFACYLGFLNVLSLGYVDFDGTLLGLGNSEFGTLPARNHARGLLLWGEERLGYGAQFKPEDPETPPLWRVGVLGLIQGPVPSKEHTVNCPKILHLGWVGFMLNCKFGQWADFALGWTTLDIMNDDTGTRGAPAPAEPPPPRAGAGLTGEPGRHP